MIRSQSNSTIIGTQNGSKLIGFQNNWIPNWLDFKMIGFQNDWIPNWLDSKLIGTFPKYLEWNETVWKNSVKKRSI